MDDVAGAFAFLQGELVGRCLDVDEIVDTDAGLGRGALFDIIRNNNGQKDAENRIPPEIVTNTPNK